MPRYRFSYTVETPLAAAQDITLTSEGLPVTLNFANRIDSLHVRLDAVADGATWREANENAMDNVISPVLDVIALHQKAPAMLQDLLFVVKAAEGPRRRAVVVETRKQQQNVMIDEPAVNEVQTLLNNMPRKNRASMRWLRYCYRPINVLERFVYSWLAFEDFLGSKQVRGKCPACEAELPPHPSIDREAGCKLTLSVIPDSSADERKRMFREWWTELRSAVFHGGRVASTPIRTRMQEAMNIYRPAMENRLQESAQFELAHTGKTPNDGLVQHDIYHFIEFPADNFAAEFVDPPAIRRVVEDQRIPVGVRLLDFQADTQQW
jgi:hypothetical protein